MSSAAMCKIGFGESGCRALRVPAPAIAFADPPIALLSLSPAPRDHHVLRSFLPTPRWIVRTAPRLSAARNLLRRGVIQVVLCDRDLRPGSWKQALNWLARLPRPPYLIVTSRIADEAL